MGQSTVLLLPIQIQDKELRLSIIFHRKLYHRQNVLICVNFAESSGVMGRGREEGALEGPVLAIRKLASGVSMMAGNKTKSSRQTEIYLPGAQNIFQRRLKPELFCLFCQGL